MLTSHSYRHHKDFRSDRRRSVNLGNFISPSEFRFINIAPTTIGNWCLHVSRSMGACRAINEIYLLYRGSSLVLHWYSCRCGRDGKSQ